MSDWFETLEGFHARAWQWLGRGAVDAKSALHRPCVATIGADGSPRARVMVLRAAEATHARLEVHTDAASEKAAEIAADARASFLFWEARANLQIRARTTVTVLRGDAVAETWSRLSDGARRNYGGDPTPGTPIDTPGDYAETAARDRLAILSCAIDTLELLHLGDTHRRAVYDRWDNFAGRWVAP